MNIYSLVDVIKNLAIAISLKETDNTDVEKCSNNPPKNIKLWTSDYAYLALWPVSNMSGESILKASEEAEEFLDFKISKDRVESNKSPDAYVVLALPKEPGLELLETIRHVRMQRRFCRRNVVWETSEGWIGVEAVPILALPNIDSSRRGYVYPDLESHELNLIERLQAESQSGNKVADEDILSVIGADNG